MATESLTTVCSVLHLTASTFFGGPERQMLGLARHLEPAIVCRFLSYSEGGRCREFLEEVRRRGYDAEALTFDTPHLWAAVRELTAVMARMAPDLLLCHGYKANLLGRIAARRAGIPVLAVSRGWTYENWKIRTYELLDRINLRWMDRVVCVSEGQARKVRRAGVPDCRVVVIPNAIDASRFDAPDQTARTELEELFPRPVRLIVGAAGRLSPEKGFSVLIDAAEIVARSNAEVGFVLFGDGALQPALAARIAARGLSDRFVLAGFRPDLERFVPALDLLVQSSYTEGMPNVVLEACAAGIPVVATAVGGTPEIIVDRESGHLIPPGDSAVMARRIQEVLDDEPLRRAMGAQGRAHIRIGFNFASQAERYRDLIDSLLGVGMSKSGDTSLSISTIRAED